MKRLNNLELNNTKFDAIVVEPGDKISAIKRENGLTFDNSAVVRVQDDTPYFYSEMYAMFAAAGIDTGSMEAWIEIFTN